ncbi:hypothetical protein A2U01_0101633, partial [Trifolium medium]|nr:hypothetical protein [Trifolium medium]
MEQYMAATDARLRELSLADQNRAFSHTPPPQPNSSPDVTTFLKTLRINVPRFDDTGVEDWIYKINKLFTLHQ